MLGVGNCAGWRHAGLGWVLMQVKIKLSAQRCAQCSAGRAERCVRRATCSTHRVHSVRPVRCTGLHAVGRARGGSTHRMCAEPITALTSGARAHTQAERASAGGTSARCTPPRASPEAAARAAAAGAAALPAAVPVRAAASAPAEPSAPPARDAAAAPPAPCVSRAACTESHCAGRGQLRWVPRAVLVAVCGWMGCHDTST